MRLKVTAIIILSVLIAGCMFAMTNKAQTPTSSLSTSQTAMVAEPASSSEAVFPLNESTVKQLVVIGAVVLLVFIILKSNKLAK